MVTVFNKGQRKITLKTGTEVLPQVQTKLTDEEADQLKKYYASEFEFFYNSVVTHLEEEKVVVADMKPTTEMKKTKASK